MAATLTRVREVLVRCVPCRPASFPPLDATLTEDDDGGVLGAVCEPEPMAADEARRWARDVSADPSVRAVYLLDYEEDSTGAAWREAYERYRDGRRDQARRYATSDDPNWPARLAGPASRRHDYLWRRWPLSEVARQLGYDSRLAVVAATEVDWLGGRKRPVDVPEVDEVLTVYLPLALAQKLTAAAEAAGSSEDRFLAEALGRLSPAEIEALAAAAHVPRERMRARELAVPADVARRLRAAAVEADSSLSHILQQAIARADWEGGAPAAAGSTTGSERRGAPSAPDQHVVERARALRICCAALRQNPPSRPPSDGPALERAMTNCTDAGAEAARALRRIRAALTGRYLPPPCLVGAE